MKFSCEKLKVSGKIRCKFTDEKGDVYVGYFATVKAAEDEYAKWVKMAGIKDVEIKK
jgi:hypothetical protein